MADDKPNHLIIIGGPGQASAYLNISKEEAVKRYNAFYVKQIRPVTVEKAGELAFHEVFEVHDAWESPYQDTYSGFCDATCEKDARLLIECVENEDWYLKIGYGYTKINFCPYCGKRLGLQDDGSSKGEE